MDLRPYQQDMIDRTREALRHHSRLCLVAPTGAGKTALTVHMMQKAAQRGNRALFIVHQNELLMQTSKALWLQKLEHGIIASGKSRSGFSVQVASVLTLKNRLKEYDPWDLIIIDEAHRSAAETYKVVLGAYPSARVIGLTATPQRTDGKGLSDLFQTIVEGPTITQLIEAGYLCDYELFAPPIDVDISEVKTVAGDYNKGQLEAAVDRPTITGDAVQHYMDMAHGKRCVVMCVTIKHAQHVAAQYQAFGISAASIEGTMSTKEREDTLEKFRNGEILVLTNVQLLVEGVDIPGIEVLQWLRPTQSLIVWMQGNGRGFRPSEGKDKLIILDHVNNWSRHGMPDTQREWSLDGRPKQKRGERDSQDLGIQSCGHCLHVFRSGVPVCPKCGKEVELKERKIEQVDGLLEKIERQNEIKHKKIEQGTARSLEDLVALGIRRKLNNAAGWAVNVYSKRQKRAATAADYQAAKQAYGRLAATTQETA